MIVNSVLEIIEFWEGRKPGTSYIGGMQTTDSHSAHKQHWKRGISPGGPVKNYNPGTLLF